MRLYEQRDDPKFKNVLNLSEAYLLLKSSEQARGATKSTILDRFKKLWDQANADERERIFKWAKTNTPSEGTQ
jgi:hypothetical protein